MAQQRWIPGVERDDYFVSSDIVFQKINDQRGNGICAGAQGIQKNKDLIVEGALLCSVLNKIRFPSSSSISSSDIGICSDDNYHHHHHHYYHYCSMCCCFMGSVEDEVRRLESIVEDRQKRNPALKMFIGGSSNNNNKNAHYHHGEATDEEKQQEEADLFRSFEKMASKRGFSAKKNPSWFAKGIIKMADHTEKTSNNHHDINNSNNNDDDYDVNNNHVTSATSTTDGGLIFNRIRCDRCHQSRCLVPDLPQTLEEVGILLQTSSMWSHHQENNNDDNNNINNNDNHQNHQSSAATDDEKKPTLPLLMTPRQIFTLLIHLTKTFDEGLFGITRAILMLVDEVAGGCTLSNREKQQKRGNWVAAGDESKGTNNKRARKMRKKFKRKRLSATDDGSIEPSLLFKERKSTKWLKSKLISLAKRRSKMPDILFHRSFYFADDNHQHVRCSSNEVTTNKNYVHDDDSDDDDNDEQQHEDKERIRQFANQVFKRINFFCSCFDAGLKPKHSSEDISQYRKATTLINLLLTDIAFGFCRCTTGRHNDEDTVITVPKKAFRFISLSQLLTLRCCLQNNQHRALIRNPLQLFFDKNSRNAVSYTSSVEEANMFERIKFLVSEDHPVLHPQQHRHQSSLSTGGGDRYDDDDDPLMIQAQALFVNTSRLNHCCKPSASVEPAHDHRGCCLRVKSLSTVKPNKEIRISYVELDEIEKDKKKAHRYLKRQYGFDCED